MEGSEARARAPYALLHAARQFVGVAGAPARQTHLFQGDGRLGLALRAVYAGQFQAKSGVVQYRHVWHECERLEHHADVLAAQGAQLGVGQRRQIDAIDQDTARRGFDQTVEDTNQGGFTGAGQAHDHKYFAGTDGEVGVEHANGLARTRQDILLAAALPHQLQCGLRCVTEYLEHMFDGDFFGHGMVSLISGCRVGACRSDTDATSSGASAHWTKNDGRGGFALCCPWRKPGKTVVRFKRGRAEDF